MDRLTRKELKTDKVAVGVEHTVEYLAGHKKQVRNWVAIGAAVVIAAGGWWIYSSRQASARAEALATAMHVGDAVISDTPQSPNLNFATQLEKDTAVTEAYTKVANEYPNSQEGAIARLYLAGMSVDKGDLEAAIKLHEETIDRAPDEYASVAKQALAEIYASQGKLDEAEKLLRDLIDDPSAFVSSEEATLTLGRLLSKDKPEEARKLLEPLRDSRTTISRTALDILGKLPASTTPDAPTNN